jgi:phage regulator Rha-like protein
MNQLMKSDNPVTMSSREIADLVGSRHADVVRTIDRLIEKGVVSGCTPSAYTHEQNGQQYVQYVVCKRDSYIVVAQLCPQFTARLVDRWQELESQQFTIPSTLPDALRLAADLADEGARLRLVIADQAPQVEALQRISEARGTMCLTDAAKHLGVQRKRLIEWMRANRWIYRRESSAHWLGYQPRLQAGLLEHRVTLIGSDDAGDERLASQVRVTGKGMAKLALMLEGGAA